IGVPVSTTQAIIGAILGIGIIKGGQTINFRKLTQVSIGWLATPFIAALLASLLYFIANLHYMPD
ncbi:MAG: inorganic phosphate transporter, partial [Lentisphaerae bacterium]|nr:inorganic phosphate transporter [Lentisphaerota bacterium]